MSMKMGSIAKAPKKALGSITTTNLSQNLLIQGAVFSVGAIAGEYADSYLQTLVAKIPIGLPISVGTLTQIVKAGLAVFGLAFLKNKWLQMGLFGIFAQSILSIIRGLLPSITPSLTKEAPITLTAPESTFGQW